jgi:hypothetical protein
MIKFNKKGKCDKYLERASISYDDEKLKDVFVGHVEHPYSSPVDDGAAAGPR